MGGERGPGGEGEVEAMTVYDIKDAGLGWAYILLDKDGAGGYLIPMRYVRQLIQSGDRLMPRAKRALRELGL